jgi:cysteinyl-tRNA synthetase
VRIYNTLGGKAEEFVPQENGKVNMYVCGLTPYDSMHIGHARTFVAFDIIRRWLAKSYRVFFVQNVTDVDDKIIRRANERGEEPVALSARFDAESRQEMKALGVQIADRYPKVSEHMPQIVALIGRIIENGFAYANESGVYFDVMKFEGYGKLSKQDLEQLKAGARIEVDEKKRSPVDFALWKAAKPGEPWFPSPWGRGRPGWHIECSAMSACYIDGTIDIHGGARDLVFPHHENEIAQSEAAGGGQFVRYWMHSGFLTVNGEKMAKSLGNFITVKEALGRHDANSLRLFFALAHYRSPIDFSWDAIRAAGENVEKLMICSHELGKLAGTGVEPSKAAEEFEKKFAGCMDNDFDTPGAAAVMFDMLREANRALSGGGMPPGNAAAYANALGMMMAAFGIEKGLAAESGADGASVGEAQVGEMLRRRADARKMGDYAESDRIRSELEGRGIIVEDKKGATRWRRRGEMKYNEA